MFGSAKLRRTNFSLQAAATSFINNILLQYPHEHFLWSDGAYRRSNTHSSAATIVTIDDNIHHSYSVKIGSTNIATAEICGILINLNWLLKQKQRPPRVHIMCDNQYAIKVCLKQWKSHSSHVPLFHAIHKTVQLLAKTTSVQFHSHPCTTFLCQIAKILKTVQKIK